MQGAWVRLFQQSAAVARGPCIRGAEPLCHSATYPLKSDGPAHIEWNWRDRARRRSDVVRTQLILSAILLKRRTYAQS